MDKLNPVFTCAFCDKTYKREQSFLQHECERKIRIEQMQSLDGQRAYDIYCSWLKAKKNGYPSPDAFLSSGYFVTFMRFSPWAKKLSIDVNLYIRIMVARQIDPKQWDNNDCYVIYLEYLDRLLTPMENVRRSLVTLSKMAQALECSIPEVINNMNINHVIHLLQTRSLSPWIILTSATFKERIKLWANTASPESYSIFLQHIRPQYWRRKFTEHANEYKMITKIGQKV